MNHISFEVGDRVRHKITRIQAEIVQLEESLAMPHVWVIEPSQCEVNPPKLYRIIDLEKVESGGKKTNNQAQCVNLNISRGNQELEVDTSTSKQFPPDKSIDFATIFLSDRKPKLDTLTSKEIPGESVLTLSHETTTQRTEPESLVLTVESLDLTIENQTTTVSTINRSGVLTVEHEAITVSTNHLQDLTVENDTTEGESNSTTERSNKRRKGKGTGRIQLRTITKQNGKQYQQFWYDWQVHTSKKTIYKSVYIPKRLLKKIQALESAQAPVSEILEVLGVVRK